VARNGDRLQVFVEDDGKGCAPEDLERIFEPFFSTKSGPARRGLGMFIVQAIVENHGGRIKVQSKNGTGEGAHGLVFLLDFPMSLPAQPASPGFGSVPAGPGTGVPGTPELRSNREAQESLSAGRRTTVPEPR
jgi:hypothetical protein